MQTSVGELDVDGYACLSLPMPPETQALVPTRTRVTSKLSPSGKKWTFTAMVFSKDEPVVIMISCRYPVQLDRLLLARHIAPVLRPPGGNRLGGRTV